MIGLLATFKVQLATMIDLLATSDIQLATFDTQLASFECPTLFLCHPPRITIAANNSSIDRSAEKAPPHHNNQLTANINRHQAAS